MVAISPASKPFVGVVESVDLSRPLGEAAFREIRDAWARYPVLVFPGQEIDTEAHQAFAERFGKLAARVRPMEARGDGARHNPYLMLVSNIRDEQGRPIGSGSGADGGPLEFHSDGCFNDMPAMATLLHGIEIPDAGGDTLFVDMSEIYEVLSPATRRRLSGREAVNYFYYGYSTHAPAAGESPEERRKTVRHAIHPTVIVHPVTGKPSVFVNRLNTREIVDMDPAEADDLLEEIFRTVERPEFAYAHKWRIGDLVLWDNRTVQHARSDFPATQRRLMRRFAVAGSGRPVAHVPGEIAAAISAS